MMCRFAFLRVPAALMLCATFGAHAEPAAPQKRPAQIRFLCVADDLPLRYVKGPGGGETPVFAGFDEEPPNTMYMKRGGKYVPTTIPRNNLGKPHSNGSGKSDRIEGYFIRAFGAENAADLWARTGAKENQAKPGTLPGATPQKQEKEEWAPLAVPPPSDGRDYLVCVYQPSSKAKWYPPKTRFIDISPAIVPAGALLIVNLSDRPAAVRVGDGKTVKVAPGDSFVMPMPVADAPVPVAVAARGWSGDDLQMISSRPRTLPSGQAGVLALYSMYQKTSDKPMGVKFTAYEVPPPLAK